MGKFDIFNLYIAISGFLQRVKSRAWKRDVVSLKGNFNDSSRVKELNAFEEES